METLIKFVVTVALAGVLLALLPSSPFTGILEQLETIPYINQINWFIPVGRIITVTTAWATAVFGYWLVGWVLRQLDIIGA